MATNAAAPKCPGVVVLDNLTCGNCGRAVAQYPEHRRPDRPMVWQHRRGNRVGQTQELRSVAHAESSRATRAEALVAELQSDVLALEDRLVVLGAGDTSAVSAGLARIEAKLDQLLTRPTTVEWRPDHRRRVDGGERVADQRKRAGVPLARAVRQAVSNGRD